MLSFRALRRPASLSNRPGRMTCAPILHIVADTTAAQLLLHRALVARLPVASTSCVRRMSLSRVSIASSMLDRELAGDSLRHDPVANASRSTCGSTRYRPGKRRFLSGVGSAGTMASGRHLCKPRAGWT